MERAPSRRNGIRGVKGHNMDEISFARIPLAHSDPEKVTLTGEGFLLSFLVHWQVFASPVRRKLLGIVLSVVKY